MSGDDAMSAPHATGKTRSGETGIFYRLFGNPGKTPVLIVHGLSYFSYDWIEPAAKLATDRQVAAMDMRGFGDSDWAADYSVPAMAGDILAVLGHLGWQRAILIGHSMGGRSCTFCAAESPQRVAGLILVDYSPDNAPAGSKRVAQTVAATPDAFATIEDAMKYFGADPHSPQGAEMRPRFEAYLKPVPGGFAVKRDPHFRNQFIRQIETGERHKLGVDMWMLLGKLVCPTLVMRGTRSDMFAPETVPKLKTANPNIALVEVDAGHNIAGENGAGFLREVRMFFDSIQN